MTTSALNLARRLQGRHETLAVAESCTGGLLGAALTAVPGCSRWFRGGWIVYSNDLKIRYAGVPPALLRKWGAVSVPVAAALAAGVRRRAKADWGVGITGIAGPAGGTPAKPVGLVFIGVNSRWGGCVYRRMFQGNREHIRRQACAAALDLLRAAVRARETDSGCDRVRD